ncbi:MAG: DUF3298 and DUF4163 domain-containing protein [Cellulosilyticaceae bacterium]
MMKGYVKMVKKIVKKSTISVIIGTSILLSSLVINAKVINTDKQSVQYAKSEYLVTSVRKVEDTDVYKIEANIPQINNSIKNEYIEELNDSIDKKIYNLIEEAKERALGYEKIFIETGGKKEKLLPVEVDIDYSVKYAKEGILSIVINYFESYPSAYNKQYFYNVDFMNNNQITLDDLFEEGYEEHINKEIKKQMEEREKTKGTVYFENFEGIAQDQNFYIDANGKVVVVFEKYEIAPGAMGIQEFTINNIPMKTVYSSQANYKVEQRLLDSNNKVEYPEIVDYEGNIKIDDMNKALYSIVEKYNDTKYKELRLGYRITRMDESVLSITFFGSVDMEGLGFVGINDSINIDIAKTGEVITVENYIKQDEVSQTKWNQLMNEKVKEKGLIGFEAEGVKVSFKDNRIVFYYKELDDKVKGWISVTMTIDELDTLIEEKFSH